MSDNPHGPVGMRRVLSPLHQAVRVLADVCVDTPVFGTSCRSGGTGSGRRWKARGAWWRPPHEAYANDGGMPGLQDN